MDVIQIHIQKNEKFYEFLSNSTNERLLLLLELGCHCFQKIQNYTSNTNDKIDNSNVLNNDINNNNEFAHIIDSLKKTYDGQLENQNTTIENISRENEKLKNINEKLYIEMNDFKKDHINSI